MNKCVDYKDNNLITTHLALIPTEAEVLVDIRTTVCVYIYVYCFLVDGKVPSFFILIIYLFFMTRE